MLTKILESNNKNIVISTGNVLAVNKKAGQKPTEELIDCLDATLNEAIFKPEIGEVHRSNDDLIDKITEHERNNIKIGAKIFLNNNSIEYLNEAVNNLLNILKVKNLDNLILAYHPNNDEIQRNGDIQSEPKEGVLQWGSKNALDNLKLLWKVLEKYNENKMICQLGISDLDTESLTELYTTCKIHPTIAQINLSACCVVPPSLQEFCNKNDIQLLTHSDPEVILPDNSLSNLGLNDYKPNWTIRYQVHVKCRGLLNAKGFIVGASKKQ